MLKHKISFTEEGRPNHPLASTNVTLEKRQSEHLAKTYGVTVRAVQDIWNRRSWAFATSHLWQQEPFETKPSRYSLMSAAEVFNHPISCMSAPVVIWTVSRCCSCVDRDVRKEPRTKSH